MQVTRACCIRLGRFLIAASFIFSSAPASYCQGDQSTAKPASSVPSSRPTDKAATGNLHMSQVNVTGADLASYASLCKALDFRGVPDKVGSSIVGISKESWFNGAVFVEMTASNDIFQIRWNKEHKPYFDGSILGVHLDETLDEFQRRFPGLQKVSEGIHKAKFSEQWSIVVTAHVGKVIDDIAINNDHYSLVWRPR